MKKEVFAVNIFVPSQMFDARSEQIARSANNSVDSVTFAQKQIAQIRAILTSNAGDQGNILVTH